MKKTLRRLHLDRETVRRLTPENLEGVVGAGIIDDIISRINSCNPLDRSIPQLVCA
jgi:hypothetical protein